MSALEEFKILAYEHACHKCQSYKDGVCQKRNECVWSYIEEKLKELEILERTALNLVHLEGEWHDGVDSYFVYDNEFYESRKITKEEYDVLKEMSPWKKQNVK